MKNSIALTEITIYMVQGFTSSSFFFSASSKAAFSAYKTQHHWYMMEQIKLQLDKCKVKYNIHPYA
jgi:hypothetical protein